MAIDVHIKKTYGDFTLDIAFSGDSKRIGILGASGCGKSLTLKSVAGLVRPDEGRIVCDGRVLFDSAAKVNVKTAGRSVGYMFQDFALFPNMTVAENIGAALYGAKRNVKARGDKQCSAPGDIDEILSRFKLTEIKDHKPHKLSGGQKQRTALARMMACDPSLLLFDEPFSSMDAFLREGMRLELMDMLDRYDRNVIFVSHDRDELYQMCDHLVLMDKGRVIVQGKTDDVFSDPVYVSAARLTGCKNISRIEATGPHSVKALDWNGVELITEASVDDSITHIGIRAHDIMPGRQDVNAISCSGAVVSRLPFEWYVTFDNGLWWKVPKGLDAVCDDSFIPEYINIPPDKILLLK